MRRAKRRRAHGDRRELLGVGPLGHRGVGDQHGMVAADDDVDPERGRAGLVVDHHPHLAQRLAERARRAGDHRVGLAQREHRRGKDVAVLVDHPLDLAAQQAVALVLGVDEVDGAPDQRRIAAVEHFIVLRIVDPELLQQVVDVLAADQHRRAVAGFLEGDRGAQHVGLLAFREQHALGVRARRFIGEAHHRRRSGSAARAAAGGRRHVLDRLLRARRSASPLRRRPRRPPPSAAGRTARG